MRRSDCWYSVVLVFYPWSPVSDYEAIKTLTLDALQKETWDLLATECASRALSSTLVKKASTRTPPFLTVSVV